MTFTDQEGNVYKEDILNKLSILKNDPNRTFVKPSRPSQILVMDADGEQWAGKWHEYNQEYIITKVQS